jgi:hypothetical protein
VPKLIYENELPSLDEFQKALAQAMSATNPVDDLLELANDLWEFEQKHRMSSLEFYEKYRAGSLDDELQHCLDWWQRMTFS